MAPNSPLPQDRAIRVRPITSWRSGGDLRSSTGPRSCQTGSGSAMGGSAGGWGAGRGGGVPGSGGGGAWVLGPAVLPSDKYSERGGRGAGPGRGLGERPDGFRGWPGGSLGDGGQA